MLGLRFLVSHGIHVWCLHFAFAKIQHFENVKNEDFPCDSVLENARFCDLRFFNSAATTTQAPVSVGLHLKLLASKTV